MEQEQVDIALMVDQLVPNAKFRRASTYAELRNTWLDDRPLPTMDEINVEWQEYLIERTDEEVVVARRDEYPSIEEQLDALWDRELGDNASFNKVKAKVQATRDKHPKRIERANEQP